MFFLCDGGQLQQRLYSKCIQEAKYLTRWLDIWDDIYLAMIKPAFFIDQIPSISPHIPMEMIGLELWWTPIRPIQDSQFPVTSDIKYFEMENTNTCGGPYCINEALSIGVKFEHGCKTWNGDSCLSWTALHL